MNVPIIVVMTKNTCYFILDRVWNIHVETTENSISRFLDFNTFWVSNLPQKTPRSSRLWRSQYFPLLRNIRRGTNTPSQTEATRLTITIATTITQTTWGLIQNGLICNINRQCLHQWYFPLFWTFGMNKCSFIKKECTCFLGICTCNSYN